MKYTVYFKDDSCVIVDDVIEVDADGYEFVSLRHSDGNKTFVNAREVKLIIRNADDS